MQAGGCAKARPCGWSSAPVPPPPVKVPQLAGEPVSQAQANLQRIGLGSRVAVIAAPGVPAGTVTSQSPAPGTELTPSRSVALDVAETPHWQPVTSLAGSSQATTVRFHVRGTRWRVVYTMSYQGTCTFIFFCSGPGAQVDNTATGSPVSGFSLSDGGRQTRVFDTGPGGLPPYGLTELGLRALVDVVDCSPSSFR